MTHAGVDHRLRHLTGFFPASLTKDFVKIVTPFAASGWEHYVKFARFSRQFPATANTISQVFTGLFLRLEIGDTQLFPQFQKLFYSSVFPWKNWGKSSACYRFPKPNRRHWGKMTCTFN
jgi:hypothetical protein